MNLIVFDEISYSKLIHFQNSTLNYVVVSCQTFDFQMGAFKLFFIIIYILPYKICLVLRSARHLEVKMLAEHNTIKQYYWLTEN